MKKSFAGRTPLTEYKITAAGRKALTRYLDHMEALIRAMKGDDREGRGPNSQDAQDRQDAFRHFCGSLQR